MFVREHLSLMFQRKARAVQSRAPFRSLPRIKQESAFRNVCASEKNVLAYLTLIWINQVLQGWLLKTNPETCTIRLLRQSFLQYRNNP